MKKMNIRKKLLAFAVGTLTLAGLVSVTPVAFGAEGNIDTTQKGSITIHKLQNPDDGKHGDGTLQDSIANEPVAGVTFSYAKVTDIDLTKSAGWQKLKELKVDSSGNVSSENQDQYTLSQEADTAPTNASGETKISDLELGVYLIKEKTGPDNIVKRSAPFLVTVPYPGADTKGGWLYDVHVYPKNTVINPSEMPVKIVKNSEEVHFPGDTITWAITQVVPGLSTTEHFTVFDIVDELPQGVNAVDESNVKVTVEQNGVSKNISPNITVENQKVTVSFSSVAQQLLRGDKITVEITAVVSENVMANLSNQSHTKIRVGDDQGSESPEKDLPSKPNDLGPNPVPTETKFAPVTITKVNKAKQKLDSAQFEIYPAGENDQCVAPQSENAKRTLITGGKPGHKEAEAGVAAIMVVPGKYCLFEKEAPIGYTIDPEWADAKIVTVADDGLSTTVTNLSNEDAEGNSLLPKLPLTGAAGFILLTFAGIAILATAAGTGFVAVGRKKREREA